MCVIELHIGVTSFMELSSGVIRWLEEHCAPQSMHHRLSTILQRLFTRPDHSAILQRSIDYVQWLEKEAKRQEEEVEMVRREVTGLKIMKDHYQQMLALVDASWNIPDLILPFVCHSVISLILLRSIRSFGVDLD